MPGKYKVGLSRNRLFEFDNAVVFCGKLQGYNKESFTKALKMLCLKEPVITAVATMCETGECYIETDAVEQELVFSEYDCDQVKNEYALHGLDFSQGLFKFVYSSDEYLVIVAHTLVADCKSLLRLAMDFSELCSDEIATVVPSEIVSFPDITTLPLEVNSPLTDRLSAELDNGWQKRARVFGVDDYRQAKTLYFEKRQYSSEVNMSIDSVCTARLKEYSQNNALDLSSVVAFAFYKAVCRVVNPGKKQNKMCIHADRRFFLQDAMDMRVGAFNGFCEAYLSDKEKKLDLSEQVKAFQKSCYRGVTSPFRTFYDEVLLMKVSSSYCDSAYMYMAGMVKDKASKKLAENYGCMNLQLCEFFSCNLDQEYWSGLDKYTDISVSEPLKNRFSVNIGLVIARGCCQIAVKFNKTRLSEAQCADIVSEVESILGKMK